MNATGRRNAMIVYAALMALSILWASLILAAPWLMAERHYLASAVIYKGFSAVCHQSGTVVLLSRGPDGRLLALREHLRGVHHRPAALPLTARSARRSIPAPMDIDRRRRPDSDRFRGRSFRVVCEYLSFAGADRVIIRNGRRFLRDARPRLGVERLARLGGEP